MPKKILCCGILRNELEHLLEGRNIEVNYLDPALHVDLDKLAKQLVASLENIDAEDIPLIIGNQCHPELAEMTAARGGRVIGAKNCIEMLLGEKMLELDAENKTFYLTGGWLENWRQIFIEGLKWDAVDARQNFGFYKRILLLDTGVVPIDEMSLLEFFDYAQVPVETMSVGLDYFQKLLEQVLDG